MDFFETNPYAEIITQRTSNDTKITHPKSTGTKPGRKTLHPAAVQNERQLNNKRKYEPIHQKQSS